MCRLIAAEGELELHVLAGEAAVHGRESLQLVLHLLLVLLVQVPAGARVKWVRAWINFKRGCGAGGESCVCVCVCVCVPWLRVYEHALYACACCARGLRRATTTRK